MAMSHRICFFPFVVSPSNVVCLVRLSSVSSAQFGSAKFGSVHFGWVQLNPARLNSVRLSSVRLLTGNYCRTHKTNLLPSKNESGGGGRDPNDAVQFFVL